MKSQISLFICDDQATFRDGLNLMLTCEPLIKIVGQAENGLGVLNQIQTLKPDILILDLLMPVKDGVSVVQELKSKNLKTKVLILSQHGTRDWLEKLIQDEVDGYILKSDGKDCLMSAINSVFNGDKYFSPSIASGLYEILSSTKKRPPTLECKISPKELEVASYTSQGFTVNETAQAMKCSLNTIKTHKSNLMRKIGAKNSAEITRWYLQNK